MKFAFFSLLLFSTSFAQELCFVVMDAKNGELIEKMGDIHAQDSPSSTFKIALSLMSYDKGILIDEHNPVWPYEGQDCYLEIWKQDQDPASWMAFSPVWFSRRLTPQLGLDAIVTYLNAFQYGNCDFSGGLKQAWLNSSLKISPLEQLNFLRKLVLNELPVSEHAMQMTKKLLFVENFNGYDLFAKTGSDDTFAWLVGWFEKENQTLIFALKVDNFATFPSKQDRINLVKKHIHSLL